MFNRSKIMHVHMCGHSIYLSKVALPDITSASREREGAVDRELNRQTETKTETNRDRQTDRQTETETDRQTETETDRQRERESE